MSAVPFFLAICTLITLVTARYGLLAITTFYAVFFGLFFFPIPDGIAWYTARGLVAPLFFLALAIWAFRTSLGNQKLFATDALDL